MTNFDAVAAHLSLAGYSDEQIAQGLAYAKEMGAVDEDEALSLATSRILYSDEQLADGNRFPVEPGSVEWR